MDRREAIALALLVALGLAACSKVPATPSPAVFEQRGVEVRLRSERGVTYQHPVEIDARRMVQVLGAIRARFPKQDEAQRAVSLEIMPEVAKGVSKALALAEPGQVVAVSAVRKERRIGILDDKYLTTFLVYQKDGRLHVDFSRIDWKVPKGFTQERMPVPRHGITSMRFDLETVPPVIESPGPQIVAIDWRDPAFSATPASRPLPAP